MYIMLNHVSKLCSQHPMSVSTLAPLKTPNLSKLYHLTEQISSANYELLYRKSQICELLIVGSGNPAEDLGSIHVCQSHTHEVQPLWDISRCSEWKLLLLLRKKILRG